MVPRPVISPTLALRAAWSTNCSVVRALMNACSRACCSILTLPWLEGPLVRGGVEYRPHRYSWTRSNAIEAGGRAAGAAPIPRAADTRQETGRWPDVLISGRSHQKPGAAAVLGVQPERTWGHEPEACGRDRGGGGDVPLSRRLGGAAGPDGRPGRRRHRQRADRQSPPSGAGWRSGPRPACAGDARLADHSAARLGGGDGPVGAVLRLDRSHPGTTAAGPAAPAAGSRAPAHRLANPVCGFG